MRFRGFAAIVAVALTAAACTSSTAGHPTASTTPPTTGAQSSETTTAAPATTSPSVPTTGPNVRPGQKVPTIPDVAKTRTRAGAIAFAGFWFQTWDWAYATTNATLMERYYAKSCADCALAAGQFSKIRRRGEHFVGGELFFLQSEIIGDDHRHAADYAVDVTEGQRSLSIVDASGKTVERDHAVKRITFRLWLRWTGGAWIIVYKAHVV